MKKILFLLLPLIPALALAQTGTVKDSVRVLTTAEISAGNTPADTSHFYYIEGGSWKKVRMDSIARVARLKLAGNRGDVTVSSNGLTWDLNSGVVDSMQLSAGAVVLPGAKVTGTLPVSKGGTGSTSYVSNYLLRYNGTKLDTVQMSYKNVDAMPKILLNIHPDSINFQDGLLNLYERNGFSYIFWYGPGGSKGRMGLNDDDFIFSNYRENDDANVEFRTRNLASRFTLKGNGNVGIGVAAANITAQLHTNGSVRFEGEANYDPVHTDATGNLIDGGVSDFNLKNTIQPILYGISSINQLNPVSFLWNDENRRLDNKTPDIGFIAQDVMGVIPDAVRSNGNGELQLDYKAITATLVKAMQEQQAQIQALQQRIIQLENK